MIELGTKIAGRQAKLRIRLCRAIFFISRNLFSNRTPLKITSGLYVTDLWTLCGLKT